jgi:predicted metalloendopeptidase
LWVNGTWLKETDIPDDKSNYGSFGQLADLSESRIQELIEEIAKGKHEKGSNEQKVGDFYNSFMNESLANEKSWTPIAKELEAIDAIESKQALFEHWATLGVNGVGSPAGLYVSQDAKNSTEYIVHLTQSGLTLPDRDYYLKDDDKSSDARAALTEYIETLFTLTDIDEPKTSSAEILDFETELAKVTWARVELRDANKRYNKYDAEQLKKMTPSFDWTPFFLKSEIEDQATVIVNTPSFFEGFQDVADETNLDVMKLYTKFRVIDAFADYLSEDYVNAYFELHDKQLGGVPSQKPRWKKAVASVAGAGGGSFGALGEVVGELYVGKYFKPDAKAKMDLLVKNLLASFGSSIDDLAWMTDETKSKAKEKLSKIKTKIGYPTKWRDYSKLTVEPDDLVGNIMRSNRVEHHRNVDKLGKPIDREEWGMTPQTVNAYYNPTKNEIVFPAAILQPPFFSLDAPAPLNYGGIGAVIGHEISHAFDDQGSKYDGDGNLKNWWTESDGTAFQALKDSLIAQYEVYEPLPGKTVDGNLTLGENIADLSGLSIAYKAMNLELAGQGPIEVAGWNQDQLFFVGWSRVWQRKYRDAEMLKRLLTDSHSPSQYRANGPVTNIDAFYKAFDLKEGDRLFKPESDRIKIW